MVFISVVCVLFCVGLVLVYVLLVYCIGEVVYLVVKVDVGVFIILVVCDGFDYCSFVCDV